MIRFKVDLNKLNVKEYFYWFLILFTYVYELYEREINAVLTSLYRVFVKTTDNHKTIYFIHKRNSQCSIDY